MRGRDDGVRREASRDRTTRRRRPTSRTEPAAAVMRPPEPVALLSKRRASPAGRRLDQSARSGLCPTPRHLAKQPDCRAAAHCSAGLQPARPSPAEILAIAGNQDPIALRGPETWEHLCPTRVSDIRPGHDAVRPWMAAPVVRAVPPARIWSSSTNDQKIPDAVRRPALPGVLCRQRPGPRCLPHLPPRSRPGVAARGNPGRDARSGRSRPPATRPRGPQARHQDCGAVPGNAACGR